MKLIVHDDTISEVMTELAVDYYPNIRWVEPAEATLVTSVETLALPDGQGYLVSYKRATSFAGNLTEALRVIDFK